MTPRQMIEEAKQQAEFGILWNHHINELERLANLADIPYYEWAYFKQKMKEWVKQAIAIHEDREGE